VIEWAHKIQRTLKRQAIPLVEAELMIGRLQLRQGAQTVSDWLYSKLEA
jgi:hypothetical protein